MIKSFEDLKVYQLAREVVAEIYRITAKFPPEERFGLTLQMRRAAISIISNIAEGGMRLNPLEFRHFVSMARGSTGEVSAQLSVANMLHYSTENETEQTLEKLNVIGRMLTNLAKALSKKSAELTSTKN